MGRRKIEIKEVKDRRAKEATLKKRRLGLFKKAYELGILTGTNTYVFIEDKTSGRLMSYLSTGKTFHPNYSNLSIDDRHGPERFGGESVQILSPRKLTAPPPPDLPDLSLPDFITPMSSLKNLISLIKERVNPTI